MRGWRAALCGLLVALTVTSCGDDEKSETVNDSETTIDADTAAIEHALNQWPNDFNEGNVDGVCSLFAPDVVVKYPDSADRDHDAFCTQMKGVLTDENLNFRYAAPDIAEIRVDGDLATVQLIWTLTVTDKAGTVLETVREDGVDVFVRQPDGRWKIRISHAYPA